MRLQKAVCGSQATLEKQVYTTARSLKEIFEILDQNAESTRSINI
jgi:predicted nucleic-acid-binding Zn-ribbon protein